MIGRLSKFSRFLAMLIAFCPFASLATMAKADCSGFAADAGQTFGVSLKRDPETRKVLGFYMVGEASFVAPKSSLVRKAKKKAFNNGKADFVRFMKEDFVATDLISDLTNTIETTDSDGNTTGTAEEINAMVETMASNSSAVLSGIVVLGECVDVDSKLVMVQAGWKPELSEVAADAKQNIKKSVTKGDASVDGTATSETAPALDSKIKSVDGYSLKSKNADDF